MAGYAIAPLNAPLPTAWNLPFQPDAGIQTSILMFESLDGLSVAASRQNAGRPAKACGVATEDLPPSAGDGGVNAPASTIPADVIVAAGSTIDANRSHKAVAS